MLENIVFCSLENFSGLARINVKVRVMHPYTTDTSPEAEAVQLDLIRSMTASERAMKAVRMTTRLIRECKATIARNNPSLTPREIGIAFIELNYGKDLAEAVDRYQSDLADGQQ